MKKTSTVAGRRYVLHTGLPRNADDTNDDFGGWDRFDSPERLKQHAEELGLPPETRVMVEWNEGAPDKLTWVRVVCTIEDVARWSPTLSPLPEGRPERPEGQSLTAKRLRLLVALRSALDRGVSDGLIEARTAEALMLAVDDLVARPPLNARDPAVELARRLYAEDR